MCPFFFALLAAVQPAITNGAPDDGDAAVVAIVKSDGSVWCTGTLIGPHTVLTAAHCMVDAAHAAGYRVAFGATAAAATSVVDVSDGALDPMWDANTFAHDVALVTTRQAAPTDPIALDPRALDGTLVGQTFRAVGFGMTAAGAGDQGTKRSGSAQVTALGSVDFTTTGMPSQPCTDDSGGPALFTVGGVTYVTGVTSHGDSACLDHAVYARVDTAAAFIQAYQATTAPGTASTGDRCFYDEQCSGGPCLQAADDPSLWFCGKACGRASDCPPAMVCDGGQCRHPVPSPGALGAACSLPSDCVGGICYAAPGAGGGVCTRRCVAVGADSCPAGYECDNGGDVAFYCLKTPSHGGCAAAPSRGGAAAWLVIAALALIVARGRARTSP